MNLFRFLTLSFLCTIVLSLPLPAQQRRNTQIPLGAFGAVDRCVPAESVDKFTTEWFLSHTLPEYRREIHGKALFYTKGASEIARKVGACSKEYVTLWQIWPEWLYNDSKACDNPLRRIHGNEKDRQMFYENMSRAFARMARKSATVMHMTNDYDEPPENGIWGKIEQPTLRHQTDVLVIGKTDNTFRRPVNSFLTDKSDESIIRAAIEEVQSLFRSAKYALSTSFGTGDTSIDTCTMWASREDGFLDDLW